MDVLNKGLDQLNEMQLEVYGECILRKNYGLSLPMGSGKTLLSLVIALKQAEQDHILVVVAKTLISNWQTEIKKFFGDSLKYEIFHTDFIKNMDTWKLSNDTKLVITTPDVVAKYYKDNYISTKFIKHDIINAGRFNQHSISIYQHPIIPYLENNGDNNIIFSKKWGFFIIDEVQKYTNITSIRCQALGAICSNYKLAISGTILDEPIIERILGYHVIIDDPDFPRNLPYARLHVQDPKFEGIDKTLVQRKVNLSFIKPQVNQYIISHEISVEEKDVYMTMKNTMKAMYKKVQEYKHIKDTENIRKFSCYMLAMLCYLRQCLVCPIVPLASLAIDIGDLEKKSDLAKFLNAELEKNNLSTWLNDINSAKSSRIKRALEVIDKHKDEKVIIFTTFKTSLDIMSYYLPIDREKLSLNSTMSTKKRYETLKDFEKTKNGILLLSYELGAEGLNLQFAHTVLFLDFWWNSAKTQQAIARVLRFGQKSSHVNLYLFTSNTGLENSIFKKQIEKNKILDEIKNGPLVSTISTINMKEIIRFLDTEENSILIKKLNL